MTKQDIDAIIKAVCPNDEDYEKPVISPAYLRKELESLALETSCETFYNNIDNKVRAERLKSNMLSDIYMEGINMCGEYQVCWVRFRDIERIVNKYLTGKEDN